MRGTIYNPGIGRFTSTDPKGFAAGDPNLYRFVKNSPTNATDPSGLQQIEQAPAPRRAEKIQIVNAAGERVEPRGGLRVAKWENAFKVEAKSPGIFSNPFLSPIDPASGSDFIDTDKDRFYVHVYDPVRWELGDKRVTATLYTLNPKDSEYANSGIKLIPLVRDPLRLGWWISDSQLLVSNKVDNSCSVALPSVDPYKKMDSCSRQVLGCI